MGGLLSDVGTAGAASRDGFGRVVVPRDEAVDACVEVSLSNRVPVTWAENDLARLACTDHPLHLGGEVGFGVVHDAGVLQNGLLVVGVAWNYYVIDLVAFPHQCDCVLQRIARDCSDAVLARLAVGGLYHHETGVAVLDAVVLALDLVVAHWFLSPYLERLIHLIVIYPKVHVY